MRRENYTITHFKDHQNEYDGKKQQSDVICGGEKTKRKTHRKVVKFDLRQSLTASEDCKRKKKRQNDGEMNCWR